MLVLCSRRFPFVSDKFVNKINDITIPVPIAKKGADLLILCKQMLTHGEHIPPKIKHELNNPFAFDLNKINNRKGKCQMLGTTQICYGPLTN